eukprot:3325591-Amphidinium_carterae.1
MSSCGILSNVCTISGRFENFQPIFLGRACIWEIGLFRADRSSRILTHRFWCCSCSSSTCPTKTNLRATHMQRTILCHCATEVKSLQNQAVNEGTTFTLFQSQKQMEKTPVKSYVH